jgi:hypothetical protein
MFVHAEFELNVAYRALGDAADWLRSDWQPVSSSLTTVQSEARTAMFEAIGAAKAAVNRAKDAASRAVGGQR